MSDKPQKKPPDRPLECGECKKPLAYIYTEISGENMIHTSMCGNCPELARRLYGTPETPADGDLIETETGLCCGTCETTLEAVKKGVSLGCPDCYEVFGDLLLSEMQAANKLSPRIAVTRKTVPIHIGRTPGESAEINPSLRLLALNEALKETLNREDYEQAAWLRDQIKELTENSEKPDEGKRKNEGKR